MRERGSGNQYKFNSIEKERWTHTHDLWLIWYKSCRTKLDSRCHANTHTRLVTSDPVGLVWCFIPIRCAKDKLIWRWQPRGFGIGFGSAQHYQLGWPHSLMHAFWWCVQGAMWCNTKKSRSDAKVVINLANGNTSPKHRTHIMYCLGSVLHGGNCQLNGLPPKCLLHSRSIDSFRLTILLMRP